MINNWRALLLAVLAGGQPAQAVVLAGCQPAQAAQPEPLQGVVEHDRRRIGFELGGRVLAVEVERGQRVAVGAVLARLDDGLEQPVAELRTAELRAAEAQLALLEAGTRIEELRAAEAEIAALSSQQEITLKNLARQQGLAARGALAPTVVDETAAALQTTSERKRALEQQLKALRRGPRGEEISAALSRVEAARAALAAQQARLARYQLTTLAAGHVTDVHVEPGEMVAPAAPAVTLADLDHPYVDVFVPQARMQAVRIGQAARTRVDGLEAPLPGRVEHIFPGAEFTPRYLFSEGERSNLVLRVRVRVDDPDHRLHAGVPAFVTLQGRPQDAARSQSQPKQGG